MSVSDAGDKATLTQGMHEQAQLLVLWQLRRDPDNAMSVIGTLLCSLFYRRYITRA